MKHRFTKIGFPASAEELVSDALERAGIANFAIERTGVNHIVQDDAFQFVVPPETTLYLTLDHETGLVVADFLGELLPDASISCETGTWDDGQAMEEYRESHQPIQVTPTLTLKPFWRTNDPASQGVVINTEPGGLFGSGGEHSTTMACLTLIQSHLQPGSVVADLGSGSGILAVASIMLGAKSALCVEIEEMASEAIARLAELNGVANEKVDIVIGDVLNISLDIEKYDMIYFNIGPKVTREFFTQYAAKLRPQTRIVLSGITLWAQNSVLDLFSTLGRTPLETISLDGEWVTFLL